MNRTGKGNVCDIRELVLERQSKDKGNLARCKRTRSVEELTNYSRQDEFGRGIVCSFRKTFVLPNV